jgi:hypothetical protein
MPLRSAPGNRTSALRNAHRGVLALLVACGVAIGWADLPAPPPAPDPWTTTAGVGLALAAIVLRRFASSPIVRPSSATFLALGALFSSAGLGLLGARIAFQTDSDETGLLFTLAGLIFALRVPRPAAPPQPR